MNHPSLAHGLAHSAAFACAASLSSCTHQPPQPDILAVTQPAQPAQPAVTPAGWKITFADEFDGAEGTAPDATKWTYDLGGHGWGNNELQCYTKSRENSFQDGKGNLVIRAVQGKAIDEKGNERDFSSARLLTKGLFSQRYGRFEARVKLPRGKGIWPAFWMLGDTIDTVPWPECGEIDAMEFLGQDEHTAYTSLHGPGYSGTECKSKPYKFSGGGSLCDDFHVFAVEWSRDSIRWSIDGTEHFSIAPAELQGKGWPFDKPFFMILNLAVGGNWPGAPDEHTTFPQELRVDYVRVYEAIGVPK